MLSTAVNVAELYNRCERLLMISGSKEVICKTLSLCAACAHKHQ